MTDVPVSGMQLAAPDGRVIASRVRWTQSRRERKRGLLDLPPLRVGEALVIERARQVHTFGMRYPIDVVFCDKRWVVRRVLHALQPGRLTRFVLRSRYAIELPADAAQDINRGNRLSWIVNSASGTRG